tara:strand:- start:390 stop:935 length:546 start_codon:yes stop_codon:yes gene_type:complete
MKIYFDGCSYTRGDELSDPEKTRFSKIIANKLNSIDYNFAISGGSNRRIARNLLEKDLSQYDIFIIQFTKILRTEYYNGVRWIKVKYPEFKNNKFRMGGKGLPHHVIEFWKEYYNRYYHDMYGETDKKICYHAIKNLLHGKKYLMLDIDQLKDMVGDNRAIGGHPDKKGHEIIAQYILDNI